MTGAELEERRRQDRDRQRRTRERRRSRRAGIVVVELHVPWNVLRALERLELLDAGERAPEAVAAAVADYLGASASSIADLGERFGAL